LRAHLDLHALPYAPSHLGLYLLFDSAPLLFLLHYHTITTTFKIPTLGLDDVQL